MVIATQPKSGQSQKFHPSITDGWKWPKCLACPLVAFHTYQQKDGWKTESGCSSDGVLVALVMVNFMFHLDFFWNFSEYVFEGDLE